MSKLTELLDELCPDGVEYRVLGDFTELSIGKFVKKTKQRDDFEYPVYNGGAEPTGYFSEWNAEADSIVIAARGSIGFVNFVTTKFWAGNSSYVLKNLGESIDRRYLYHYLKHHEHDLYKLRSTGSIPAINKKPLSQMLIGIPPLEVQQEIVRVLDAFTDLEQSLVSELELRKKQMSAYIDDIFENLNAPPMTLGDVGKFTRGSSLQKKDFVSSGVPCIHYGQVYTQYGLSAKKTVTFVTPEFAAGKRTMKPGDLFVATTSENEEDLGKAVAWLGTREVVAGNDAFIYRHELNPKFASYFFASTSFQLQKRRFITGTKVRRISDKAMSTFKIPIPSLEDQAAVVAKLDSLESLIQSIEREISLRRKQYEFYRDELLSFAPKED